MSRLMEYIGSHVCNDEVAGDTRWCSEVTALAGYATLMMNFIVVRFL